MPKSAYFVRAIMRIMEEHSEHSFLLTTHITPGVERIKKMFFLFPSNGMPSVVATLHQKHGSCTSLVFIVTNLKLGSHHASTLLVSRTDKGVNRNCMKTVLSKIRTELQKDPRA